MPRNVTVPANPYSRAMPNRKNAEANAPSRKYFSAASWLTSRRRRAMAHSRYSGSEKTSSATNIVSRSLAETNSIMPASANSVSGKTSVAPDCAGLTPVGLAAHGDRGLGDERATVLDRTLGHEQQRDDAEHGQRALQEQRRTVDGDGHVGGQLALAAVGEPDDGHQRRDQRDQRQHDLEPGGGYGGRRRPRSARRHRPRRTGSASAPSPRSRGPAPRGPPPAPWGSRSLASLLSSSRLGVPSRRHPPGSSPRRPG